MFRLDGKTALITGASQGIGEAIARRCSEQGARVILAARNESKLNALADSVRESGGEAHVLPLDLSKTEQIEETLGGLPEEWSDIDVVINNAGITRDSLAARMKPGQWQEVLDTNLTGAWTVARYFVRPMMRRRSGRILFVSSVVGLMGNAGQANYAASKAGIIGVAKSLARELGSRGVTVNVIAPGFIETAMTDALDEKAKAKHSEPIALGRFGTVDEIAAAAVFLASDSAGYITGEVLNVSGGMYM